MNNLQWLYGDNGDFAQAVDGAAAEWLGTTSTNFAHEWLSESHGGDVQSNVTQNLSDAFSDSSDYWQAAFADADAEVARLESELAKRNKGIERLKRQRDEARDINSSLQTELEELTIERDSLCSDIAWYDAECERLNVTVQDQADEIKRMEKEHEALQKRYCKLATENIRLCNAIDEASADREAYREKLGRAMDAADLVFYIAGLDNA